MGLVFAGVMVAGAVIALRSLRLRGCVWFLGWVLLGMAMTWFALQFISGTWRV